MKYTAVHTGFRLSGHARAYIAIYHYVAHVGASGHTKLSGKAITAHTPIVWPPPPAWFIVGTGGAVLSGSAKAIVHLSYVGDGSLYLTDEPTAGTLVALHYFVSSKLYWHVLGNVTDKIDLLWSVGRGILYYYQVEGECSELVCDTTSIEEQSKCKYQNKKMFIETVAATDLADLCKKLKQKLLNYPIVWPIKRIRKFSRPVYLDDIKRLEDGGVSMACNVLSDENEFVTIPECLDFAVNEFGIVEIGIGAIQISDDSYNASGTVTLSGSATTTITTNVFAYRGAAYMRLRGSGIVQGNWGADISGSGGMIASGDSPIVVTLPEWHYVGGGDVFAGGVAHVISRDILGNIIDEQTDHFIGIGGLTTSGSAVLRRGFGVVAIGKAILGGNSLINGTGGEFIGPYDSIFGMSAVLEHMSLDSISSIDLLGPAIEVPSLSIRNRCGCIPIKDVIQMRHNIGKSVWMKQLLKRAGQTIPEQIPLIYDKNIGTWRTTYHFTAPGLYNQGDEKWMMLFEWGCVSQVGPVVLSDNSWKFSFLLRSSTGFETRLICTFMTDEACFDNVLDFGFKFDTFSKKVVATTAESYSDIMNLYDSNGLFSGGVWSEDPVVEVRVATDIQVLKTSPYDFTNLYSLP